MSDWTLFQWLATIFGAVTVFCAVAGLLIGLLAWRRPKRPDSDPGLKIKRFVPFQVDEIPEIYATSGVPTLQQLIEGIQLDARKFGLARILYDLGLEQFNHYVNNRVGVMEESRSQMDKLAGTLSQSEICDAEQIGESRATIKGREHTEAQYTALSPQARIYAGHKKREIEAMRRIARDLETNTPSTDYASVKARIASGKVKLDSILSELPVSWQDIRTLNERAIRPKITGKPPKREFLFLSVMTRDKGLLVDERAEKDGDWIISKEHRIRVPYQTPVPLLEHIKEGAPPVRKGEAVVITEAHGSEWDTEYWRKDGRRDQEYRRARDGTAPEQLRSAYLWRLITRAAWAICGSVIAVDIILLAALLALQRLVGPA